MNHGDVILDDEPKSFVHHQIRCSIVVSISACHAEDPGSIPGGGTDLGADLGAIGVALGLTYGLF